MNLRKKRKISLKYASQFLTMVTKISNSTQLLEIKSDNNDCMYIEVNYFF